MSELKMKCKFCGVTLKQLMFYGLIDLFGGKTSPDPMYCSDSPSHKHELVRVGGKPKNEV